MNAALNIEIHEPRRLENGDFYTVTITLPDGTKVYCPNKAYARELLDYQRIESSQWSNNL